MTRSAFTSLARSVRLRLKQPLVHPLKPVIIARQPVPECHAARHLSSRSVPTPSLERLSTAGPRPFAKVQVRRNSSVPPGQAPLGEPKAYTPISPNAPFARRHPFAAFCARLTISSALGVTLLVGLILGHDAFTYSERHSDRVPADPLCLHPRRGGKKNLPIIEANLDDEQEDMKDLRGKPRLVIVGGGWGSVALIQSLPTHEYNVTLISPQTYFAFTPLLPSACVGTVEVRSLVEPLRKLVARVRGHYLMGSAVDIDMSERMIEVEVPSSDRDGQTVSCYVPYDKLVLAVGSKSNDHGVKGLEHCFQLKSIHDAQAIRRKVMDNLELASLPTTTPEERHRLLSFVVCGGGPTGVEFAAELSDMMAEDVLKYYPKILASEVSVKVIQSRDHILNTYSEKISEYAEKRFQRNDVEVVTNARVQEVNPDKVIVSIKNPEDEKPHNREIDAGFVLWSTGIAMQPFTKRLVDLLPNQFHSKAVQTDAFQRVEGAPKGTVYAIGDGATLHVNMMTDLLELWDKFDRNKDDALCFEEWQAMAAEIQKRYPLTKKYLLKLQGLFDEYDKNHDQKLSLNEVAVMFEELSRKVTALPATAQVASQQGKYLGKMFTKLAKSRKGLRENDVPDLDDEAYYKPFEYQHLGSLAYIGNSAVFDYEGWSLTGGLLAMYAWRSIYWSEQTSMRTRMLLMLDWIKRGIFGRDLSKF